MELTRSVDVYCERIGPEYWAEPLNAVSNLAFLLASFWGAFEARRRGITHKAIWLLIALAFCIGVGSFLFHTFANTWSGFADTVPIWTFVATYILVSAALIGGAPPGRIAVFVVAAIAVPVIGKMSHVASSTSASIRMTNEIQGGCLRMLGIFESG